MTRLSRRTFLNLVSLLLAGAGKSFAYDAEKPVFISAASDSEQHHWVKAFTIMDGRLSMLYSYRLQERAHAVILNRSNDKFVVMARRPGTFMVLGDVASGAIHQEIQAPAGRHFYGHGVFSADDRFFYTTESDYEDMQGDSGRIGVWRFNGSDGFERVDELPTYAVGPHELLLMPDSDTLVVANGGIRTHPDLDRDMLNLDTMQPSLAYINRHNGDLLEQHQLPPEFHQASIRHIDLNAEGRVALSMQFEGEPFLRVPLLATHRRGEELRPMLAPEAVQSQMEQYVGSVRYDASGRFFVASCPRANMLTFWNAESGEFIRRIRARDACGVCAFADGFVFSAGTGQVRYYNLLEDRIDDLTQNEELVRGLFWDNHLVVA